MRTYLQTFLRLDPAAGELSGGGAGDPPAPAGNKPPAQEPPKPQTVVLDPAEYQRLLATDKQWQSYQSQQTEEAGRKEAERLKLLADKEGAEKALAEQRSTYEARLAAKDQRIHARELSLAVASVMPSTPYRSAAAAAQAQRLLSEGLKVVETDDGYSVVDAATGKPAADVIAARLASDEFAHFLAPSTTGGTGAAASVNPPGRPPGETGKPLSVGEQLLQRLEARQSGKPAWLQ